MAAHLTPAPAGKGFLALRENNLTTLERCPACGNGHKDADVPLWIFAYGTRAAAVGRDNYAGAVCGKCAKDQAPKLAEAARALGCLWFSGIDTEVLEPALQQLQLTAPVDLSKCRQHSPRDAQPGGSDARR